MKLSDLDILLPVTPPKPDLSGHWGFVTASAPLRVRLDGDASELPLTPVTLVSDLSVGDRVWCVLTGRQLVVQGRANVVPVARASMVKTSTGPALTADTWGRVQSFATPDAVGVTADATTGAFTVVTSGTYDVQFHQRWQFFGTAYVRIGAIVKGTSAPASGSANVLAMSTYAHTEWLVTSASALDVPLVAGDVLSFWVRTAAATATFNNTSTLYPPTSVRIVQR